jgi:hypothetical protein
LGGIAMGVVLGGSHTGIGTTGQGRSALSFNCWLGTYEITKSEHFKKTPADSTF